MYYLKTRKNLQELQEDKLNKKIKQQDQRLLEGGKIWRGRKKKIKLTFLKIRPGRWENWSSPLRARPKVNWGVVGKGGRPWRGRKLFSNETEHCFTNPAHLSATAQPQHNRWRSTQLRPDWSNELSV